MQFPHVVKFCDQLFLQDPGAVIPAIPQSDHFAALEQFVRHLKTFDYSSVLDLGTGSGLLGISLWRPGVDLVMTDLNPQAVSLATANSRRLSVPAQCLQGSWFEPIVAEYDLVIANPPHGTSHEWNQHPWAHEWIPKISVDGGLDGLDSVRTILLAAHRYTRRYLCLIYALDQHSQVLSLAHSQGFDCVQVYEHAHTVMGCFTPRTL